jgi:lipopolysaccharide assembly outer membrane protein LptD (OstA)
VLVRFGRAIASCASGLLLGAGALLLGAAGVAFAQEPPPEAVQEAPPELQKRAWDITADSISYERERDVYTARGNVRIVQPGRSLSADWLAFSNTTRRGVATGHVVIEDAGQKLEADVIHFELDALRGVLLHGRLEGKQTGFLATGEEVRKLGEQEYEFEQGSFTTCRCPDGGKEPWVIRAEEAELEIGGYGTARNTVVDVLGVPVFWLPWMKYPLLTDRATGLLFPVFNSSSRTGFDVGLPFFWAALPNLNVTVTPHYLFDRGFKPELELEYVFGEKSWGELFASGILGDDEVDSDDPDTPYSDDRYAITWLHDQHLPEGWRWKVDGRLISDNAYPFDFRELRSLRSDRYIESLTFAETRFGTLDRFGFHAGARYADDIQNPDDMDRDRFLLQRAGELALSGVEQPIAEGQPFEFSFDTQLVNFYPRENAASFYGLAPVGDDLFLDTGIDGVPDGVEQDSAGVVPLPDGDPLTTDDDDPNDDDFAIPGGTGFEGDGVFQEGEPLVDRGQRLIVNPRVALPLRLADLAELRGELGYHGTYYETHAQAFESRHLGTALVELRTRLRRALELPFEAGRATHLLEPRLAWTSVTDSSQDDNPLFVPRSSVLQERLRQLELGNVLRDPSDRIEETNALTLALGNRLFVPAPPSPDGVLEPPRLFADLTFSAAWDFSDPDLRNLFLDGVLFPARSFRTRFNTGWDLEESDVSEALFEFAYADEVGNDLGVAYRKVEDVPAFFEDFPVEDDRFDEFEEDFEEINQIELFGRYAFTKLWAASYRLRYSFEGSVALTNQVGLEYISRCRCWAVMLEFEQDRQAGYQAGIRYRIVGLGDDTVRPFASRRRGPNDPLIEGF